MSKPMLPNTDIVYVDECGVNTFMTRNYARAKIGKRVYSPEPGRKYKRINIVGALINGVASAIRLYNWAMTAAFFAVWFEWDLCTLLRPGSIIIMDNASFHKKSCLEKIAAFYKCYIVWLPPYSPDKNKIEKTWANMKNWLRINAKKFPTIQEAIEAYFKSE